MPHRRPAQVFANTKNYDFLSTPRQSKNVSDDSRPFYRINFYWCTLLLPCAHSSYTDPITKRNPINCSSKILKSPFST